MLSCQYSVCVVMGCMRQWRGEFDSIRLWCLMMGEGSKPL